MPRLLYFADPMCSWCYGFGPALARIHEQHPKLPVVLVMGGLRAYNAALMDQAQKDLIRGHWEHVREASGQPFDFAFFAREGFVYDTEPACRAVVTARELEVQDTLGYFHALQNAFYAEGRDITQSDVLLDVAQSRGIERAAFATAFESDALRERTREDFLLTLRSGVEGFPTLALEKDDGAWLVTGGYLPEEEVVRRVTVLLTQSA